MDKPKKKTLTDVVEILSGGTPKTKISEYWEDGEIPFFGPGDANGSTYCLTTAKRITQLGLENCNSELYPVDTVFLTARGTVGKVAMAGKPMAMNQSCFAFRGLGVSQPAVYQIIKRAVRSLKAKAKAKANGATFAAINTRDLKIEEILVPSDEELTAFEEGAASLHSMMRVNEEESLKLSSLRDVLLPKLIAGEIDVSKIDFTQLNSHLAASSRHLPGHLTDPLIRVPRRKSSHPRRDLMCRFFSSFPRRGREYASQRHVKWLAALLPYREIGGQRWRSDGRQPATCGFC
ncbi:MAG: restriction endonuclease subunit S [Atopobiaceae bacterium]